MHKLGVLIILSGLLLGCQLSPHHVSLKDVTFNVVVANDDNSRAMGLMYKKTLPIDGGMLFIFPDSQPRAFWMKNTLIPLDILYFNHNRILVSVQANVPPCKNTTTRCPNYPSGKAAQYVLDGDELILKLKK